MLEARDIERKLSSLKPELAERFHVGRIGFFGSYATGNQTPKSDLDVLVEFVRPVGWEFFQLEQFLENALELSVDLVTINAIKERTKDSILSQVRFV